MTIDITKDNKPLEKKDGCCGDGSCGKGQCKCKGGGCCLFSKICGFFCKIFGSKKCCDSKKDSSCSTKKDEKKGCCGGR
jgi:hypothetical protein